jgi:hypothetical protein
MISVHKTARTQPGGQTEPTGAESRTQPWG